MNSVKKNKLKEIGLVFSTISAEPKFKCPFGCSVLTDHIGWTKKDGHPVWKCHRCKKRFNPVLHEIHHREKIEEKRND